MPFTVGSLFSGIGGFELGFERAGFEIRWQVELDDYCTAVLAKHWPTVTRYRDVRTVGAHILEPVDILIGGFPCQDVSDAGARAGIDGERSGLWREYARLIGELRPRFAVVENVRGLLIRGIDRVCGNLAALGYDAEWTVVRASDVGAPHKRARVFLVAYTGLDDAAIAGLEGHQSETREGRGHIWQHCGPTASDERLADAKRPTRQDARDGEHDRSQTGEREASQPRGANLDGDGVWPSRPGESQHAWEPPRVLRRAQSQLGELPHGISRGLVRHRRRAIAALGNAIVPQVAEVIAWRVRALLEAQAQTARNA